MANEFQIQGLDAVLARMKGLAPELRKKGVRAAARKAMNVVRDAARARAKQFDDPSTTLSVAKNIVTAERTKSGKAIGGIVMGVGVRGGAKSYTKNADNRRAGRAGKSYVTGGTTWYWRLLEFGTQKMRAQPFMRPALANNIQRVTDVFVSELNPAIDKAISRIK